MRIKPPRSLRFPDRFLNRSGRLMLFADEEVGKLFFDGQRHTSMLIDDLSPVIWSRWGERGSALGYALLCNEVRSQATSTY
jgi:hypothetical protein